jgi:hypothetical protein
VAFFQSTKGIILSHPQLSQESNLFVTFFIEAVEMKAESEKLGRPVYRDVPFIKIVVPGDVHNIIERKASDADKAQFPLAWKRFDASEAEGHVGTPLEQWPQMTRSMVKECKYFEIHTVEQLATLSDINVSRMGMGYMDLRNKAKAYLVAAAGTAGETAQAAENQRLKDMIADLQRQMNDVSEKKRGRPVKEVETT